LAEEDCIRKAAKADTVEETLGILIESGLKLGTERQKEEQKKGEEIDGSL
jgi:hypothetical protein